MAKRGEPRHFRRDLGITSRYIAARNCEDSLLADRFRISNARPANAAGWRLVVATLSLIAFAVQSYITQTHIHLAPAATKTVIAYGLNAKTVAAAQRGTPDKHPANDEPVKCPLCQAVGYAGHFVTPSATAAMLLPTAAVSILPLLLTAISPHETPSHIWQGRGPPTS
ncbi:MAG TPA: hypothetical protein VLC74_12120 [Rhizomicrobium sp.]|nr:hypothetical protein [Rhizomicrobium sp.]